MYAILRGNQKKDSPRILFIHGGAGTHRHWMNQVNYLAGNYFCLAVDLPGHGRSAGPACTSIDAYAAAVGRWLEREGLAPVVLVGHSMGGAISITLALDRPDLAAGLVLVGTGARLPVNQEFLAGLREGKMDVSFLNYAFSKTVDPRLLEQAKEELFQLDAALAYNDFNACHRYDVTNRLAEVKQNTLVVCGVDDKLTPARLSQQLLDGIGSSAGEWIPAAGHMVMVEQAERLNQVLERHLPSLSE